MTLQGILLCLLPFCPPQYFLQYLVTQLTEMGRLEELLLGNCLPRLQDPTWELLSKARLTLFTESNYRIFSFSTQLVTEDYNDYPRGGYSYLENLGSKVDLMANKETSDLSDFCQNHTTEFP